MNYGMELTSWAIGGVVWMVAMTVMPACNETDSGPKDAGDEHVDTEAHDKSDTIDGVSSSESNGQTCGDNQFEYSDRRCSGPKRPDSGGAGCQRVGDGKCYRKCESDSDCQNPDRPHCSILGLYAAGDYNCNETVKICRSTDINDCR